ncbi:YraN family protein [Massilia sp. TS11]|uniref:YraN family protein n=1 Tax=Massilia sp. TS11 TaxID=2908003 RepID=UPI001EDB6536|nr:YraN family protein [Massilia sp. TS11]MCG2585178.1 YraN family protein [Massilia sp. TS11]
MDRIGPSPTQRQGQHWEEAAARFLRQHGLELVATNVRNPLGEIDLIMRDGPCLVFVEVRQRESARFGGAAASITPAKQARLLRAAEAYLCRLAEEPPCRFDAILIEGGRIEWLKNMLEM